MSFTAKTFRGPLTGDATMNRIYGLQRLNSNYTGNIINIRRSTDNSNVDFTMDYTNTALVTASGSQPISNWIGGGTANAVIWYDQSGNGRNLTQLTNGNQPGFSTTTGLLYATNLYMNFSDDMTITDASFSVGYIQRGYYGPGSGSPWYQQDMFVAGERGGAVNDYGIVIGGNGLFGIGTGNIDGIASTIATNGSGVYSFMSCTRNSTTGQVLLYNGTGTGTSFTKNTGTLSGPNPTSMGKLTYTSSFGYLNADVSSFFMFNTIKSQSEISSLASISLNKTIPVISKHSALVYVSPAIIIPSYTGTAPIINTSNLSFVRTNSAFLNFGALPIDLTKGFTIELTFAFTDPGSYERIVDFGSAGYGNNIVLCRNAGGSGLYFSILGNQQVTTSSTITTGTYYNVIASYNPSFGIYLYINGVLAGSRACNATYTSFPNCYIGKSNNPDPYLSADIQSLKFYNFYSITSSPSLTGFRGAPLFSQLSTSAAASAVGAFSLRAVNGVTARAVQVARGAIGTFPPISMTSDNFTATGTYNGIVNGVYVSSASTYYIASGAEQPYRFFDKNNNGTWWTTSSGSYSTSTGLYTAGVYSTTISGSPYAGEWIQIQLPAAIVLTTYTIYNSASWQSRAPVDFKIAGSTNGTNWTLVDTQTAITSWLSSTTNLTFTPSNPSSFTYYRLCVNKCGGGSGGFLSIGEWVLNSYSATDFYADRLGNLLTAPVVGQSLANWLGGETGYITTWYDQSSAGNHATQTIVANQPIINTATTPCSLACTNNWLQVYPFNFNFGSPGQYTMRMVVSNTTGGVVILKGGAGVNVWNANYKKWWFGDGTTGEAPANRGLYPESVGSGEAWTYAANPITTAKTSVTYKATSTSAISIYVNGSSVALGLNNRVMASDPSNYLYIGNGGGGGSGGTVITPFIGNIHEIQIFSTALTDTDRLFLET
jgi:hypothetical protein